MLEDEIYAHRVAGQIEDMRKFGTATDTRRFFFGRGRPMCPAAFCRCLWRTPADGESSICGIGRAEAGGILAEIPNGTTVDDGVKEDDTCMLGVVGACRAGGQTGFMQLDLLTVPNTEAYWLAMAEHSGFADALVQPRTMSGRLTGNQYRRSAGAGGAGEPKKPGAGSAVFRLGDEITEDEGLSETGEPFFDRSASQIQTTDAKQRQRWRWSRHRSIRFAGNTRRRKNGAAGYADGV